MNIETVMPTLRGLTFNGRIGSIICSVPTLNSPDLTCKAEELTSILTEEIRSLNVEGLGGFLIGEDYDDAQSGKNNSPKVSGRNAVIHNSVCVVTGGAQGFGEGIVCGLANHGAHVFIADKNIEGAISLADKLNEKAGRTIAFGIHCDVTDEDSVKNMIHKIILKVGGIDLFISNAGVLKAGSVKSLSKEDFNLVTQVNYLGYFLCTKHVTPSMEIMNNISKEYTFNIISIASKSALEGSNKNAAYAGSKFGSIGLTQSFAKELVTSGIKVNTICPGNYFDGPLWSDPENGLFIQYLTNGKVPGATSLEDVKKYYESKVPMQRGCNTNDLVNAVLYLVEQQYETGQALPVTGGQVMLN